MMLFSVFILCATSLVSTTYGRAVDDSASGLTLPKSITLRSELVKSIYPPKKKGTSSSSSKFNVLQMNLCNSGFAKCYGKGLAVGEASSAIAVVAPDVVTVNEICLDDITQNLQERLASVWPHDYTYSVMMPAIDKRTNKAYKCKNGDLYGDAVIGHVPVSKWTGLKAYGGVYKTQDSDSNEHRTFACAAASADHFACTTHLATSQSAALTQCKALTFDAIPYLKSLAGASAYTVLGGDLNLKYDPSKAQNVQKCVPNGYTRKGDGSVQHVMFSNTFTFKDTDKLGILYTDHPGFEVELKK